MAFTVRFPLDAEFGDVIAAGSKIQTPFLFMRRRRDPAANSVPPSTSPVRFAVLLLMSILSVIVSARFEMSFFILKSYFSIRPSSIQICPSTVAFNASETLNK